MPHLFLTNTNFEFELKQSQSFKIQEGLEQHPVFLQLQFLPLLYGNDEDIILVTRLPKKSFRDNFLKAGLCSSDSIPQLVELDSLQTFHEHQLISWGWSRQIASWAMKKGIIYPMPDWEVVKEVNSKKFSFLNSPQLPGSRLLENVNDLKDWLNLHLKKNAVVLKSCFGVSGRGRMIIPDVEAWDVRLVEIFCEKEWKLGLPVIAEPWVKRMLDFSTQWYIDPQKGITYIGATKMDNDAQGVYRGTIVGPDEAFFGEFQPELYEHKKHAEKILLKMQKKGFFGYAGIDALVYKNERHSHEKILHPLVEVNARQTMAMVALWIQRKHFPKKIIKMSYASIKNEGIFLLPQELNKINGDRIVFTKQLNIEIN